MNDPMSPGRGNRNPKSLTSFRPTNRPQTAQANLLLLVGPYDHHHTYKTRRQHSIRIISDKAVQHQTLAYWGTVLHATLLAIAISCGERDTHRDRERDKLCLCTLLLYTCNLMCVLLSHLQFSLLGMSEASDLHTPTIPSLLISSLFFSWFVLLYLFLSFFSCFVGNSQLWGVSAVQCSSRDDDEHHSAMAAALQWCDWCQSKHFAICSLYSTR